MESCVNLYSICFLFSFVAKCLIGANNAIIPTYTAMQYPTIVRNFGVGMGNLASGIALILVPSLWQLVRKASNYALSRSLQNDLALSRNTTTHCCH